MGFVILLVDGTFLGAAAIVNVPLFLLQTKFRPEMQEDVSYAEYLGQRTRTDAHSDVEELRKAVFDSDARTLSLVEELQLQVTEVAERIQVMPGFGQPDVPAATAGSATRQRSGMERVAEAQRDVLWDRYTVAVNDLNPGFEELKLELSNKGIVINNVFGSSSDDLEVPDPLIISIDKEVYNRAILDILRIALKFVCIFVHFVNDKVAIPGAYNTIYLVSYTYKYRWNQKLATLDDDLLNAAEIAANQGGFSAYVESRSTGLA